MDPSQSKQTKRVLLLLSIVLVVASSFLLNTVWQRYQSLQSLPSPSSTSMEESIPDVVEETATLSAEVKGVVDYETVTVLRVVDGDTIEVEGGKKLRYIGVNTPETVDPRRPVQCFGKQASDMNKKLVQGKKVRLEKDISETDKFGRLLRYVYLQTDTGEVFINDYLVRQGYAQVNTFPPDVKYQQQFIQAQEEARANNRGLWATCK